MIPSLAFLGRKPGDGVEFFTQMRLILKKGEGRRSLPCPEVRMDFGYCCVAWGALCQASSPAPSTSGLHPSIPSLDHPLPSQPQDPHLRRPSPQHPLLGPIAQQLTSPRRACGPQPWPESPDPGGGKRDGVLALGRGCEHLLCARLRVWDSVDSKGVWGGGPGLPCK